MEGLVQLTITTEDTIHRAVQLRARKEGVSPSQVVNAVLQKALAAEVEEVLGVPPLAAIIQTHHDEARRQESRPPQPL